MVAALRRRISGEGGYTLVELLVTMVIMGIVLGGITGLFSSGMKAETDVAFRAQSQNEARNALSYLRQEVHCASGATLPAAAGSPPVQTLTLTMPTGCARPAGETSGSSSVWCTVYVSANRYALWRQGNSTTCGTPETGKTGRLMADYLTTGNAIFAYQAPSTELGVLRVNYSVDSNSQSTSPNAYKLVDDIVLRNTVRS